MKSYCGSRIHSYEGQEGNALEGTCFCSPRMLNFPRETGNCFKRLLGIFCIFKSSNIKSRHNIRCELSEWVESWFSDLIPFPAAKEYLFLKSWVF